MNTLPQAVQVIYSTFMQVMGALAVVLGVFDVVLSMIDRLTEGIRQRKARKAS